MKSGLLPHSPDALIIPVNFRQAQCTLKFVERISSLEQFDRCHLAIVDNNSGDDSVIRIREAISGYKNVELAASSQNRGYFGGAKWALDQYLTRRSAPDWVIVCNNDIDFPDRQFLGKFLQLDPTTVGVIAPAIISRLTGLDANPSIPSRPNAFRMLRYRAWFSSYHAMWVKQWFWPFVRRARHRFQSQRLASGKGSPTHIYAPHGSFMIFSRRFFESGGFFDDGNFLYSEEFLVAEMCRHLSLPIVHDPTLRVGHKEGQTLGRMLTPKMFQHQKDGFRYALSRYTNSYPELDIPPSKVKSQGPQSQASPPRFRPTGDSVR